MSKKILFSYKNLIIFTLVTVKFHNCHHTSHHLTIDNKTSTNGLNQGGTKNCRSGPIICWSELEIVQKLFNVPCVYIFFCRWTDVSVWPGKKELVDRDICIWIKVKIFADLKLFYSHHFLLQRTFQKVQLMVELIRENVYGKFH